MVERGESALRDLKKLLVGWLGYSRFSQRLFSEDTGELPCACQTISKCVGAAGPPPEETVWEAQVFASFENLVPDTPCMLFLLTWTPHTTPTDRHIWQSHGSCLGVVEVTSSLSETGSEPEASGVQKTWQKLTVDLCFVAEWGGLELVSNCENAADTDRRTEQSTVG